MPLFQKNGKRLVMDLPIHAIRPNPNQPRKSFPPDELDDLAQSIARLGILQPLSVRRCKDGWELIAGERRLRAAVIAGLSTVPCLEVAADETTSSLLALVENVQRQDLDFWEEALALRRLIDTFHLSQEEAAAKVGKSQSAVANKLRRLKLPEDVLALLRDNGLTERHARALLTLEDEHLQRKAAHHFVQHKLTVARADDYVKGLSAPLRKQGGPVPIYRTHDVRLFLNTIQKSLNIMNSAGVKARCGREETEHEITLTIHIPK